MICVHSRYSVLFERYHYSYLINLSLATIPSLNTSALQMNKLSLQFQQNSYDYHSDFLTIATWYEYNSHYRNNAINTFLHCTSHPRPFLPTLPRPPLMYEQTDYVHCVKPVRAPYCQHICRLPPKSITSLLIAVTMLCQIDNARIRSTDCATQKRSCHDAILVFACLPT